MDINKLSLEKSWEQAFRDEFQESYISELCSFIENEYTSGKPIYPPKPEIFAAFDLTPFEKARVVLIGQDPYHGPGQAHGLCFSVRQGVKLPPSLRNILKEVSAEFNSEIRTNGDLTGWADQGVLLLNRALTVDEGKPGSHQSQWESFTGTIIQTLAAKKENLVFIAWGNEAQKAVATIDAREHKILKSAHPSPLSCHRGFRGNNHFQLANEYLLDTNQQPIAW